MAAYGFERLSAQDLSFLVAERQHAPMHVAALSVLEAAALQREDGGVDIGRFQGAIESVLHWIPRYRQRLEWTPVEEWPVWIDDRRFDLGYHIRHIALPKPGSLEQLKEMASRIMARPLDRERPLWEIWLIEGVQNGEQFALLNKIHHCMIDGASGADLSQILLSPSPVPEIREPVPYMPRQEPTRSELLAEAIRHRLTLPLRASRDALAWWRDEDQDPIEDLRRRASALGALATTSLRGSSDTPMNGELGPGRSFDWLTMPLDDVKQLRRELGCSINDIVLATVAGAVRRYLFRRRVNTEGLDFRVSAPVSVRRDEHKGKLGNHVSSWIVPMPVDETEPLARVARIRAQTEDMKASGAAAGIESLMAAAEWMTPALLSRGVGLARGPINMIVTNVPGPQFPLYSVGAKMHGMYPMVPLLPGTGLGVALFSYEGRLCWGFNADSVLVPDLDAFVADIGAAFEEIRAAVVAEYMAKRTAAPEAEPTLTDASAPAKPRRRKKRTVSEDANVARGA